MKKMNLKRVKYLLYAIAAAVLVLCFAMYLFPSVVLLVIMLGLCVVGIALNLVFWRCPYCGEYLNQGGKYCSHCGNHLTDLE